MDDWSDIKDEDPLLSSGHCFDIDHEESVWTQGSFPNNYLEEFYSPF